MTTLAEVGERHLVEAEQHIGEAEVRVTRLWLRIGRSAAAGHDTALAEALPAALLVSLELAWAHRATILAYTGCVLVAGCPANTGGHGGMIGSLALLLGCLTLGELLSRGTGLPVPGAITGMGLLLAGLVLRGGIGASLETTAKGLLAHLALLLVPGGAGIVLHLARLREEWLAILAALLVSTALTLAVTALTFRHVARLLDREPARGRAR